MLHLLTASLGGINQGLKREDKARDTASPFSPCVHSLPVWKGGSQMEHPAAQRGHGTAYLVNGRHRPLRRTEEVFRVGGGILCSHRQE